MRISRVDRITRNLMKVIKYHPDVEQWGVNALRVELAKIIEDELKKVKRVGCGTKRKSD